MQRYKFLFIFTILIGFNSNLFCQIDTLDRLSYFPVSIGNKWQYEVTPYYTGDFPTFYTTVTIMGDSLMPNGKTYFAFKDESIYPDYIRIDTATLKIYRLSSFNSNIECIFFDLAPPDTEYFTSCNNQIRVDTGSRNIGYLSPSVKYISFFWFAGVDYNYFLSKGFGISYWSLWELWGRQHQLIAATINGVQYGTFVNVNDDNNSPANFELFQNYPNPFNPITHIRYTLPSATFTTLRIFDILGREVATLVSEQQQQGTHEVQFDAGQLPSGMYVYKLISGNLIHNRKMLLLK